MSKHVVIIGAGICGAVLALRFRERGFEVDVYERRHDFRRNEVNEGVSINLALSTRGLNALHKVDGLLPKIYDMIVPLAGRRMHPKHGDMTYHKYSREGKCICSISRGDLNVVLLDACDEAGVNLHFNQKVTNVDHRAKTFTVGGEEKPFEVLFGTDGAHSVVRMSYINMPFFDFNQYYSTHGYKELLIPANEDGSFKIDPNALHIWPRGEYMLIALSNKEGSFTCTLFYPIVDLMKIRSAEEVDQLFKEEFPDLYEMVPDLSQQFLRNRTGNLMTVKCYPYAASDCTLLLGDAAHAIIPFYGQGLNASLEDVSLLFDLIDEHGYDWKTVFDKYQTDRKKNVDSIADMAYENYIEMRSKVRNKHFLLLKDIMHYLGDKFPDYYASRYELVSFSTVPYHEARERGKIYLDIAEHFSKDLDEDNPDMSLIDLEKAGEMIKANLSKLTYSIDFDEPRL